MLDDVVARLDAIEAENRSLRDRLARLEPVVPAESTDRAEDGTVGRRALLAKGLVAAGAATAGAVLLGAEPAAAANGQSLVIAGNNYGTAATRLNVTAPGTDGDLQIVDSGGLPPLLAGMKPALVVGASGAPFTHGIHIRNTAVESIGIKIEAPRSIEASGKIYGGSITTGSIYAGSRSPGIMGPVVDATASIEDAGATAIAAEGAVGISAVGVTTGVAAVSWLGVAVEARSDDGDMAVRAVANKGSATGVAAFGGHIGVRGSAPTLTTDTNIGVQGYARTGVNGQASVASGIGVLAENANGTALRSTGRGGAELVANQFHLRLSNATTRTDPTGDTFAHNRGDIVETTAGDLWLCVTAGTPGTWRKLGGPATAGAFHPLATPVRVYDSRPGFAPGTVGPKTPFAANETRPFSLAANSSGVPVGAPAAVVTLSLINAANTAGALTVWANGVAQPAATTLVWGGSAGRFATTAVTAVNASGLIQVNVSAATDLAIDIVGFYR